MILSLMVKALNNIDETIKGFYVPWNNKHYIVNGFHAEEINPYPICKNTGILDKNDMYVYEYDLIKCTSFTDSFYAYAQWSEYEKRYVLRRFFEIGGFSDFSKYTIEVVGNVMLSDHDREVIERQEKKENMRESYIDNSYCPSCFKK